LSCSAHTTLSPIYSALDNPIWHALDSEHALLAEGNEEARRYPPNVMRLAALRKPSPLAYESLAKLIGAGGLTGLLLESPPAPPTGWTLVESFPLTQMILTRPDRVAPSSAVVRLDGKPALKGLVLPGPFFPQTQSLGLLFGILEAGRLLTVVAERLRFSGFSELRVLSAEPDFVERGHSVIALSALAHEVVKRGETPVLHVESANIAAMKVYERLGFRARRTLHLAVLRSRPRHLCPSPSRFAPGQ
jgi:ribosomal protein S18 acetylase RimI-like enzyme